MHNLSDVESVPKAFVFGPQAVKFDSEAFNRLRRQLEAPKFQWALKTLVELPGDWEGIVKSIPKLQSFDGKTLLNNLNQWLRGGTIPEGAFPLPNILISPLVVIAQLTQYTDFLKAAFPELKDTDSLPASVKTNTEALGLCTGTLSAFAAACSANLADIAHYGAVAIRLAILAGALVDEEDTGRGDGGNSTSFSVSWNHDEGVVRNVIEKFPETYISVYVDEKRATLTTSRQTAPALIQQLKLVGVHATEVALLGRFHWPEHRKDVQELMQFSDRNALFQLPDATQLKFACRSTSTGKYHASGKLHHIALETILLEQCQWYKTFNLAHSAGLNSNNASVIVFGPERCVPPTLARTFGSQVIHISGLDLQSSILPSQILGGNKVTNLEDLPDDRIAIIGVACQVPGAEALEEYWKLLCDGISQHEEVPANRFHMETTWRELDPKRKWFGNFIRDYDAFDHKFFKKSPREMQSTDPQHRLLLQIAYQAVEQSGYFGSSNFDKHIGCFMGIANVDYFDNIDGYPANAYSATGVLKSFLAGKVSHYFGWTGPSLTLDTACSSSTVAIHQACRAIINGECTAALAGGVNVMTSPGWYHNLAGASFLSPTGQCKPFDAKGDGYCRGEGVGAVFLKKLSTAVADGDQIFGVIASTRAYQNQNCTAITVPNATSLSDLFLDVVKRARLEPQMVTVVEAHGTGTQVGDPAEYDGIRKVFGGSIRSDKLTLTSVKGLVGHSETASGIVSLAKTLLMIQRGTIPPQASFTSINPALHATPEDKIEIPIRLKPWDAKFRAALINNYGASGSNASMIVTEAPKYSSHENSKFLSGKTHPFWLCGFDKHSIRTYVAKLRALLQHPSASEKEFSVANLSFQVSRQSNRTLSQAMIFSASSTSQLALKLEKIEQDDSSIPVIQPPPARPVILCFGGQISTFVGLDREIYDSITIFRNHLDRCNAMIMSLGHESIFPDIFQKSPIQDIVKLQTVLFAMQYSCAKAWIDCGVKVAAVLGHSFGELTALCISGVVSLKNAITMVAGRANIIKNKWGPETGSMAAVEADRPSLEAFLSKCKTALEWKEDISVACYNGRRHFTLAGTDSAIQIAEKLAKSATFSSDIKLKKLNVTNAFHSVLVDPLIEDLEKLGEEIEFDEPIVHLERATEERSTEKPGARFIAEHLRKPVFFNQAAQRLAAEYPAAIWLEAGSNSTITTMASRGLGSPTTSHFQAINISSESSFDFLVDSTMRLWKEGLKVSFWAHHSIQTQDYTPVILPPYQFEKSRHWMDLKKPKKVDARIVEQVPKTEEPKGLTTFIGYQDEARRSVRFQVNTMTEKFNRLISAHIMVSTAAVCPAVFQLDIAIDALMSLRPEFQDKSFQPQLKGMKNINPIVKDGRLVWLDAESSDADGLLWDWKIVTFEEKGSTTLYSSGTIAFQRMTDPDLNAEFERFERMVGRRRCSRLLESNDPDVDVLQGRNIYRAFAEVVDYKEVYRNVSRLCGKDNESAGRIIKTHNKETWLDTTLADSIGQIAGIFVNIMTDKSELAERGIFAGIGIDRWIRSPKKASYDCLPDVWEVFGLHQFTSEKSCVSDLFAFDPRDGSLVEVVLGIRLQHISLANLQKILSNLVPTSAKTLTAPKVPISATPANTIALVTETKIPNGVATTAPKKPKSAGQNVNAKTRDIICNLSGLEPEEVKDDSDLVEIGIDSLMGMELAREVEAAFKCTLETSQLMELTDFRSLVVCIGAVLGIDTQNEDQNGELAEDETPIVPKVNGSLSHTGNVNGVNVSNGMNGFHDTNGYHGVNGANSNGSQVLADASSFSASTILGTFHRAKAATDDFIVDGNLGTYYYDVIPKSTALCIAYILNAFEELGCPIRSTKPGQKLERIQYLPKHQKFMDLIYNLLWKDARLIDINDGMITRTAVAASTKPVDTLLQELLRDEPVHAAEHKLSAVIGAKFADILSGKAEGLNIIFGTSEGRELVSDVYAKSPINRVWIKQAEWFIEQLLLTQPKNGEPICILEVGAGTGGTTSTLVPMLARLGVPIKYTFTDLSSSLVAAARKRFKQYPFMEFKVLNMESPPDAKLLKSQHMVLANACVHATRNLEISTSNIHSLLRPEGFLLLLEMTEQVFWVDFIFGTLEGWWLFEDGRRHALAPETWWEKVLKSVGYGHIEWTEGNRPEANLQRLIIAFASGSRYARLSKPLSPPVQVALTDTTARQAAIDEYVHEYTRDFGVPLKLNRPSEWAAVDKCVLVTGTTGSLGSHLVAYLAQLPDITTVYCVNRISSTAAIQRQKNSFELRGITLGPSAASKLQILETDTSKPSLGFLPDVYQKLVHTVTHIVHNAWPMSLTRPVRAYEPQFKVMRNLLQLAREASARRHASFQVGFQFISSIGTVSYYPLWSGKSLVPEEHMTAESVLEVGYADAKLVCEKMLHKSLPYAQFRPMAVRCGQIAGSTINGYWNPIEHLAFLIKSSQTLKVLPDLQGTLSWCPVNDVAATLGELLMSDNPPYPIYHIENPPRQPWPEMITLLADALDISRDSIVPYDTWLSRVRQSPVSPNDNPAGQLVEFFSKHFIRMSCGDLILDTAKSREHSETMRMRGTIDRELVEKYISAWKRMGFLM